jgi:hypothetical protein
MNNVFWGVSTKYLQQYMNWFRVKELIKNNKDQLAAFVLRIVEDVGAYQRYRSLEARYQTLLSTQI